MKEKNMIILCVTVIVCVGLVCGTILLTHNGNNENNTNNTTNNNTTVNSTINDTNTTNNTNNTTTAKTSTSKSYSKKSSSSSSSQKINGEKIIDKQYNAFGEELITTEKGAYIRNPENGRYKRY